MNNGTDNAAHTNGTINPVPVFGGDLSVFGGVTVENVRGRYFIALGQPGFNSPANNRNGYASASAAAAASQRYASR